MAPALKLTDANGFQIHGGSHNTFGSVDSQQELYYDDVLAFGGHTILPQLIVERFSKFLPKFRLRMRQRLTHTI